jgi:hypothetical protein
MIGRGGFLKADDGRKHTKDEQENPHGKLSSGQAGSALSRQNSKISGSQSTDGDPGILFPHSRQARFCGQYRRSCRRSCGKFEREASEPGPA